MNIDQAREKWEARLDEWRRLGIRVDGAAIADEVLADLAAIARAGEGDLLSLDEAARESGYASETLRKMVGRGSIPNAGRTGAPMIRRTDLPKKPGHRPPSTYDPAADALDLTRRLAQG